MPTGGFGKHFNITDKPHGQYLTEYLKDKGISPDKILPFTNSSNTLEDAFFARSVALQLEIKYIIVVTSDYHMQRVKYIFGRVFSGFNLGFSEVKAPKNLQERKKLEQEKLKQIREKWIEIPWEEKFPSRIYENASSEQKYYDNISLTIVYGMIIIFTFPYLYYTRSSSNMSLDSSSFFLFSALLIILLFNMYLRTANYANLARDILGFIELQHGLRGFSSIWSSRPWSYISSLRINVVVMSHLLVNILGFTAYIVALHKKIVLLGAINLFFLCILITFINNRHYRVKLREFQLAEDTKIEGNKR